MSRPRAGTLASALFAALGVSGCIGGGGAVSRIVDGHRIEGRYVADEAYAAYVKAVTLEANGDLRGADAAYGEAIRSDPDSAHLWTRVGALRCEKAYGGGGADPWDAFTRASEIDPELEETWTERARCHLGRGDFPAAERAARMAIALDPDASEPVILLASVYERTNRVEVARLWLDGLVLRAPENRDAARALLSLAERTADDARRQMAARLLARSDARELADAGGKQDAARARKRIDAALLRRDLPGARRLAVQSRVSSGMVALRAAALGRDALAREQAELVLLADPGDSDARIAAAVAADLARDDAALAAALRAVPVPPSRATVSALGNALYAELLARRVGAGAAAAWKAAAGDASTDGSDELVASVVARSGSR